jgi:two-component system sensor histidine kinase/response regulator
MTRVLIVEDQRSVRETVREMLVSAGYQVIEAHNGESAVAITQQQQPDLVLCDVQMPGMSGFDVLSALRQDPTTAVVPFIFLTAKTGKEELRQGMDLGADDYLTKPFTASELIRAVQVRLQKQAALALQAEQKLDQLRQSLMGALPHELQTPLNGIMGFAQLLQMDFVAQDPHEVMSSAGHILESAERLQRLIQNFLLYSQLSSFATGSETLASLSPQSTEALVAILSDRTHAQATRLNRLGDLRLLVEVNRPIVVSQFALLKIIEELLDNAFKFSQAGQTVEVRVRLAAADPTELADLIENPTAIKVQVIDRGRGMTTEQIAAIAAYRQFDRQIYEQQGMGLGLTIAKLLAELCGGRLTLTSSPTQQTCAQVYLPLH